MVPHATALVYLAMFSWPIITLGIFLYLPPRRAVIASVLLGFMFLPIATFKFGAGIPNLSKIIIISLSTLLGVVFFDANRLANFRPKWVDLPMLIWCTCPMISSLSNDLGFYDGLSSMFYKVCFWGVPYLLGRLYCSTLLGMKELATAVFLGGLIYAPLCLIEIRLSPQLHGWVYGYHQHSFNQTFRFGGYRPTVFMFHGIMVATWMVMASLSGIALWWWGHLKEIGRVQVSWLLLGLVGTTILCKSLGSLFLFAAGAAVLWLVRKAPSRGPLIALALVAPLLLALRIPKIIAAKDLSDAPMVVGADRSESLTFRFFNEDFLADKALRHPFFGWGLWGRARIHDVYGKDITTVDSLWIIELGNEGFLGLLTMLAVFLLPVYGLIRLLPDAEKWNHPLAVPAVVCCVMVLLFLIDCMFNDMNNPAYLLAAGGLTNLRIGKLRKRSPKPVAVQEVSWAPRT
jgi:hypothetical protein